MIHRDIKPANILLENGVERVDHRSDLFSLGCVMYAMCTGHSPFRGDSIAHVIKRVTQDKPRPITDQNPEVPPWMIEIIDCLLQKNPEQRFQSAEGVVAILDQHLSRILHPIESGSHFVINQQIVGTYQRSSADIGVSNNAEPESVQSEQISIPLWLLTRIPTPFSLLSTKGGTTRHDAIGTVLIGLGATILFSLLAWLLLVAFDFIGAPQWARSHAGDIMGCSLPATFVLVFIGLLLRKQIRGHAAWKDMLALACYSVFGPLGIGYWVLQRMNRPITHADKNILNKGTHSKGNGESSAERTQ